MEKKNKTLDRENYGNIDTLYINKTVNRCLVLVVKFFEVTILIKGLINDYEIVSLIN
jgi:hypothetical protein